MLRELNPQTTSLNLRDLILLQNWTTEAYLGFGDRPGDERIWQVDIVQLAYDSPFLMRGILAVSALHLAKFHPERESEYVGEAVNHQIVALPAYRHALKEITEQNCHALLAFAGLITVYAFQGAIRGRSILPYSKDDQDDPIAPPEWFQLHRGLKNLLTGTITQWLVNGPMKHQLRSYDRWHFEYYFNPDDYRLLQFASFVDSPESRGIICQDEVNAMKASMQDLRQSFALAMSPHTDINNKFAAWMWAENVQAPYVAMFGRKSPYALVLLAMACILLHRAAPTCWYLQEAPQRIMSEIYNCVDREWRRWIAWPIREIGMLGKGSDGNDILLTGEEPMTECDGLGEMVMVACNAYS